MNAASSFELSGIGQVAINVQDLERAIEFYRDVLGLEYLFSAPPQMAFFDCGGVRLLLGMLPEPSGPDGRLEREPGFDLLVSEFSPAKAA